MNADIRMSRDGAAATSAQSGATAERPKVPPNSPVLGRLRLCAATWSMYVPSTTRHPPPVHSMLRNGDAQQIVTEVLAHHDAHTVRAIALTPTLGLARDMALNLAEDDVGVALLGDHARMQVGGMDAVSRHRKACRAGAAQIRVLLALHAGLFDAAPLARMAAAQTVVKVATGLADTALAERLGAAKGLNDEDPCTLTALAARPLETFGAEHDSGRGNTLPLETT